MPALATRRGVPFLLGFQHAAVPVIRPHRACFQTPRPSRPALWTEQHNAVLFEDTLACDLVGLQPNTAVYTMLHRAAVKAEHSMSYRVVVHLCAQASTETAHTA